MSRETPRRSVDSASSSYKRRKRQGGKSKDSGTSDPFLDMLHEVQGDLKGVASNVGKWQKPWTVRLQFKRRQ